MASPKSFPLVRGRTMRVTKLDGCCNPVAGTESTVATDGFVSVAFTANVTEAEEISVTNANGQICVRDPGCASFNGYSLEITFCDVNPCLFSLMTGQPGVVNDVGEVIGFRMSTDVVVCDIAFALELWSGVPGVACAAGAESAGSYGYLLLPCLSGGVIGDFSVENAAVTFVVSNVNTRDGNGWGLGPYEVVHDQTGAPAFITDAVQPNDSLYTIFTTMPPPEPTDGCVELVLPIHPATGAVSGIPGNWTPSGSTPPASVADLQAGIPNQVIPDPQTPWTVGQYVQTATPGEAGRAYWNGTAWVAGSVPQPPATGANAGLPGSWTPVGSLAPASVADLQADTPVAVSANPQTAWTPGQYVQTRTAGTSGQAHWDGVDWVSGPAPV